MAREQGGFGCEVSFVVVGVTGEPVMAGRIVFVLRSLSFQSFHDRELVL